MCERYLRRVKSHLTDRMSRGRASAPKRHRARERAYVPENAWSRQIEARPTHMFVATRMARQNGAVPPRCAFPLWTAAGNDSASTPLSKYRYLSFLS